YNNLNSIVSRSVGDIYLSWPILAASVGITLLTALAFTLLCKYFVGVLIWSLIAALAGGGFLAAYMLYTYAQSNQDESYERYQAYRYTGITIAAVDALFILITFALRKRIAI